MLVSHLKLILHAGISDIRRLMLSHEKLLSVGNCEVKKNSSKVQNKEIEIQVEFPKDIWTWTIGS